MNTKKQFSVLALMLAAAFLSRGRFSGSVRRKAAAIR